MGLSEFTRTSALAYSLLFLASAGALHWQGRLGEVFEFPGWREMGRNAGAGLLLAGTVLACGRLLRGRFRWVRLLEEEFRSLLAPLRARDAAVLAAASGLAEEMFFRVVLQPAVGLVIASLAFGLLHYPMNRRMVPWTVIAVIMGFALGILYSWTGSFVAVALAHGTINFIELLDISRSEAERALEHGSGRNNGVHCL